MGINGLLLQLKSVSRPTHVNSYAGKRVAIDGYSWLHKGAYSCSMELCEGRWTDGCVGQLRCRLHARGPRGGGERGAVLCCVRVGSGGAACNA